MKPLVNDLNRRITIQHYATVEVDEEGIAIKDWIPLVTVWASKLPLVAGAREYFQAAAINAEKRIQYRIRYRKDVLPNMRIVDDGKTLEIITVMDDASSDRTVTRLVAELIEDG